VVTTIDGELSGSTIESVSSAAQPVRVPASRYTDPDFAAAELEHVWPRVWQIACSIDHVSEPGDWFEYTVGPWSVLVVRGDDGVLRAFQNVCLHRGNELCRGTGRGLTELRCGYHRWAWTLRGELREVPSRRGFGVLRNDDYPLIEVRVDTWGPLVWINLDPDADELAIYLDEMPADAAWADLHQFRCSALVSTDLACNWKTLIDGFSETYHVQGIHREMLPMVDDVNSPQVIWTHVGKLEQPYGLPSPRLRDVDQQQVWEGFIEVMGGRIGIHDAAEAGPAPDAESGEAFRDHLAELIRDEYRRRHGVDLSRFDTRRLLDMSQYNVFPNVTILVFGDMLQIVKSRPGADVDHCIMDVMAFDRGVPDAARSDPVTLTVAKDDVDLGLVLNQDVGNIEGAQRGLHQPGFTHLSLSGEECRIINLHRNLERYIPAPARSGEQP